MPLPDNLERLQHISIDTLGLSDSTNALLKWHGLTHVLDCIILLHIMVHFRRNSAFWPRFVMLLFAEVKPVLVAAGCWELVLEADFRQVLKQQKHDMSHPRVVRWQGRDQDLYEIPFEQLGLTEAPEGVQFKSIGGCIAYFLRRLSSSSKYWLEIEKYNDPYREPEPGNEFREYLFGAVQPRLVELGYWRFVEEHVDDYTEEDRFYRGFHWDDEDGERDT